jgi:aldose 1-epimerase
MMPTIHLEHPAGGLMLDLSTRGATWLSCSLAMADGSRRSVILDRSAFSAEAADGAYLGATIGRYANRIGNARIRHGDRASMLTPNPGSKHQLHGGPDGFHSREWSIEQLDDAAVTLSIVSPDGDQGFPGELRCQVSYALVDAMTIEMRSIATVTAPSPVCITNHAYFNLDGTPSDVRDHRLRLAAARYLPVDKDLIPLGGLSDVQRTGFDFREGKTIRKDWLRDEQQAHGKGYDHAFLLDKSCADMKAPGAVLTSSDGALAMEIWTTLPSIQLYGGQFLGSSSSIEGSIDRTFGGVALEPQFLPDSPNHPEWPEPSCWLEPGMVYRQTIRYSFR